MMNLLAVERCRGDNLSEGIGCDIVRRKPKTKELSVSRCRAETLGKALERTPASLEVTNRKHVVTVLYDRADVWTINLLEGKENGTTCTAAASLEAVLGDDVRAVLHAFQYARKDVRRDGPR
ncbi:unnamed protein product [Heligmosomoides polygyrus]|uniref:Uncharacterized protein n=1 Tax=Heligmosomoides polygyrus TaxID=6339 RepID=A0A183GBF0_HELPZ|nr:unnamed protein product [Heligmosomoides polygyrus]